MDNYFNPHFICGGVFVPHYLLSATRISHGAKLLYRLLVERADREGEALAGVAQSAKAMGERERRVVEFLGELEKARSVEVRWHPSDGKSFRCFFVRPRWISRKEGRQQRGGGRGGRAGGQKPVPLSRHSREVCREYALARQAAGQRFRNVEGFITYLHYSGAQDEEIDRHLASRDGKADAA